MAHSSYSVGVPFLLAYWILMSETKLTAKEFAEKYVKAITRITENDTEQEAYVLGYCKCGCEHVLFQLTEPGYQWMDGNLVFLTEHKPGCTWITVHVDE